MNSCTLLLPLACALSSAAADYSTYIGDAFPYHVSALAVDAAGNTFLTGGRAIVTTTSGVTLNDVFVSKIDPAGNVTLLATFSGKDSEQANGIAVDPSGNIYIVGSTTSADFPLHRPLQSTPAHGGTGFLIKMGPDGTVIYSTYLGGTAAYNTLNAIAADAQGNAYVTGQTFASDYQRTPGLPASAAAFGIGSVSAAFFAKIAPTGDKIVYAGGTGATTRACGGGSSCFLSTLANQGTAIAIDSAGNAYIAGNAGGTGLPTTPGAFLTDGIGAFVAKVNSSGTSLGYVTLLGSANFTPGGSSGANPANKVYAIAADAAGDAYIAGSTSDPTFPATPGAYQTKVSLANPNFDPFSGPPSDAFVAKLNPTGSAVVWATLLGGTAADGANSIAVDPTGDVWISGTTASTDFPISAGFPGGTEFLAEFNPSGSALLFGSRTPPDTVGAAILDSTGVLHTGGTSGVVSTWTSGQSSAARIFGVANAAGGDISGRVSPAELISIYGLHLGATTPASASFDASGFLPTTLAGFQVTINGTPAPLLYVSDTQINAVVPLAVMPGPLRITVNQSQVPDFRLVTDAAIPQVFRRADGSTAAINQDGTPNSATNPAPPGTFVSIWATGVGGIYGLSDGEMATAAAISYCCLVHDVATNQDISPPYAGAAPGMVNGTVQINFQPPNSGDYYLSAYGPTSAPFSIFVAQAP